MPAQRIILLGLVTRHPSPGAIQGPGTASQAETRGHTLPLRREVHLRASFVVHRSLLMVIEFDAQRTNHDARCTMHRLPQEDSRFGQDDPAAVFSPLL